MTALLTRRFVIGGAVAQMAVGCADDSGPVRSEDLVLCQNLSRAIFFETADKVLAIKAIARRGGINLNAGQERAEIERVLDVIRDMFNLTGFRFDVEPAPGDLRSTWDVRFTCRAGRSTTNTLLRMEL